MAIYHFTWGWKRPNHFHMVGKLTLISNSLSTTQSNTSTWSSQVYFPSFDFHSVYKPEFDCSSCGLLQMELWSVLTQRKKSGDTDSWFHLQRSKTRTRGTLCRMLVLLVLRSSSLNQPSNRRKSHSYQTHQTMFSLGRFFVSPAWKINSTILMNFSLETRYWLVLFCSPYFI